MPRIQALDEITSRLGQPFLLRWVDTPYGGAAAVARFRHRGAVVDLSACGTFRLIFHLKSSQIKRRQGSQAQPCEIPRVGSVTTSFTLVPERIEVLGPADTVHLLFSTELTTACKQRSASLDLPQNQPAMRAAAVQALVATTLDGTDLRLESVVASIASEIVRDVTATNRAVGGLSPQASRAVRSLLEERVSCGVRVLELAQVAGISLHHFIKACRRSEGFTPHALLLHKRIERSLALLLRHKMSVEETAITVGFSSPSHFISTFRRLVGVTPKALKRAAGS